MELNRCHCMQYFVYKRQKMTDKLEKLRELNDFFQFIDKKY